MKEYTTITRINGPLIFVEGADPVGYGEIVRINVDGTLRTGQVLDSSAGLVVIQVFEPMMGMHLGARVRFLGESVTFNVAPDILGRAFNGRGQPIDNGPAIIPEARLPINGRPINPYSRVQPHDIIHTGISAIDLAATLVRGQKLPVFSGAGLPHDRLAMQLARQSNVSGEESKFAVVFAAIGITEEQSHTFMRDFHESGALSRSVVFLNTAADPSIERLLVPRIALTAAEYLAFERGMHVLVIMDDMTNYCEALREIGAARQEIPGRRGYPGYMYTDLASLYERAGMVQGKIGSITQIPILTLPGDDITHPIPDLTGFITEGQIVLSRELHNKGVYPPIDILQSLSRLMSGVIGAGMTRNDHKQVADQVFACYADGKDVRNLVSIIGEDALGDEDHRSLAFADLFEGELLSQSEHEEREMSQTLDIAWRLLRSYPKEELRRISDDIKSARYAPLQKSRQPLIDTSLKSDSNDSMETGMEDEGIENDETNAATESRDDA